MTDKRAMEILEWIKGNPSPDALQCICYAIQILESTGELEIFISEEINERVKGDF
jgi:hypothetical protein